MEPAGLYVVYYEEPTKPIIRYPQGSVDRVIWSGKTGGPKPESVPMGNAPKGMERRKGEFYGKFQGGRSRPSLV